MATPYPVDKYRRETRITLEKLDPPTTVGGYFYELATVSRFIRIDTETSTESEYTPATVEFIANVTVADKLASLAKDKDAVAVAAATQAAEIDKAIADIKV
jgi:hypothetical protein